MGSLHERNIPAILFRADIFKGNSTAVSSDYRISGVSVAGLPNETTHATFMPRPMETALAL